MSHKILLIKQGIAAIILTISGLMFGWVSDQSYGFTTPQNNTPYKITGINWKVMPAMCLQREKESLRVRNDDSENTKAFIPSVTKLNMAFLFPDGSSEREGNHSYAGQIFAELNDLDAQWAAQIYDLELKKPEELAAELGRSVSVIKGLYNPEDELHNQDDPDTWIIHNFKNTEIRFLDEKGNQLQNYSNSKAILSVASVYTYYTGAEDNVAFADYARKLWQRSHDLKFDISPVYYCDGSCVLPEEESSNQDEPEPRDPSEATPSNAESQEEVEIEPEYLDGVIRIPNISEFTGPGVERIAEESLEEEKEQNLCPGHLDLHIVAIVTGMDGLFKAEEGEYRAMSASVSNSGWNGWNEQNKTFAADLNSQDWGKEYGISRFLPGGLQVLSSDEIASYMDQLPDFTSDKRKKLIRCALSSVGRIPYYWGGKPVVQDYEGNLFGTLSNPDEKGRVLRGLDCSGWIAWVYWTALGERLPYEGTDGLASAGEKIDSYNLKPGDIALRLGDNPHVVMFLNWEANGSMRVIHESSGTVNNVTISTVSPDWPYFRRIIK